MFNYRMTYIVQPFLTTRGQSFSIYERHPRHHCHINYVLFKRVNKQLKTAELKSKELKGKSYSHTAFSAVKLKRHHCFSTASKLHANISERLHWDL